MTLLDTYGYGVGLIAGCSIINLRQSKNKLKNLLCFVLCLFSAFVNSRTGLIIIAVAVICTIFKSKNKKAFLLKIIPSVAVLAVLFFWGMPLIFDILSKSGNTTVRWVGEGVENLYSILRYGSISDLKNASFLSDLTSIPTNKFELIFGSGHSVYGIRDIIGFHSDVGYINTIWTYGIIGAVVINSTFLYLFISTFTLCKTPNEKCLMVFIMLSYYIIQLKAIVIGYNPGVYLTYFMVFSLAYFNRAQKRKHKKEVLLNANARKILQY